MFGENPIAPIPSAIAALLIPVTNLKFDGSLDLISQDDRTIAVDFVDSVAPNDCKVNYDAPGQGGNADYPVGNCSAVDLVVPVDLGKISLGPLTRLYQDNPADGSDWSDPAYAVYFTAAGAEVTFSDEANYNSPQQQFHINGTKDQINNSLKQLVYTAPNDGYHYTGRARRRRST